MDETKYFIGNDSDFILFSKNLFRSSETKHLKKLYEIRKGINIYKVAGSLLNENFHNNILSRHISGELELNIMPEQLLYKRIGGRKI